ncbi:MAG: hypothetical protein GY792_26990 [Gammaproteobacteria bacterium]|nr:hypothetical protein [Gammaproteobacteria bacterium]
MPTAVLLADGMTVDPQFIDSADKRDTPLWCSSITDQLLIDELQYFQTQEFIIRQQQAFDIQQEPK